MDYRDWARGDGDAAASSRSTRRSAADDDWWESWAAELRSGESDLETPARGRRVDDERDSGRHSRHASPDIEGVTDFADFAERTDPGPTDREPRRSRSADDNDEPRTPYAPSRGRHRDPDDGTPTRPVSSRPLTSGPVSSGPLPSGPVSSGPVAGPVSGAAYPQSPSARRANRSYEEDALADIERWERRPDSTDSMTYDLEAYEREREAEKADKDRGRSKGRGRRHGREGRGSAYGSGDREGWRTTPPLTDDVESTGNWRTGPSDLADSPAEQTDHGRRRASRHRSDPDDGPHTGQWERMTDTGQYDRTTSTGEWNRLVSFGADGARHPRAPDDSPRDDGASQGRQAFWDGHRLAGDDPRWMPTPASAPRSPAVDHPDQRGGHDGPRRAGYADERHGYGDERAYDDGRGEDPSGDHPGGRRRERRDSSDYSDYPSYPDQRRGDRVEPHRAETHRTGGYPPAQQEMRHNLPRLVPPALDATDPGWGAPIVSGAGYGAGGAYGAEAGAGRRPVGPARPVSAGPQGRADARTQSQPAAWQETMVRQPATAAAGAIPAQVGRRSVRAVPDEFDLDADNGGFLAAVMYAAAWFAVPVVVFGVWLMTLPAAVPEGCVSDVTGGGCESARAHAVDSLMAGLPQFAVALGLALVAAIPLRWLGRTWRAGSVGLAAAVVGGGLSTVLTSVFTGQPIG